MCGGLYLKEFHYRQTNAQKHFSFFAFFFFEVITSVDLRQLCNYQHGTPVCGLGCQQVCSCGLRAGLSSDCSHILSFVTVESQNVLPGINHEVASI